MRHDYALVDGRVSVELEKSRVYVVQMASVQVLDLVHIFIDILNDQTETTSEKQFFSCVIFVTAHNYKVTLGRVGKFSLRGGSSGLPVMIF